MNAALRIVIRAISAHLIGKARLRQTQARTGGITLIQRFGGALNLNIHLHMIFLDGVYQVRRHGRPRFVPVSAPTAFDMATLVQRISERVGRHLERRGVLVRDAESAWLEFDAEQASPLDDLTGHSITYRIAVGPNQGRKAFMLQTLPAWGDDGEGHSDLATAAGFSLHAGVAARSNERDTVERLCRTIARPALASSRLSLTGDGQVCYGLKSPWRDGTTHVLFEPLDFRRSCASDPQGRGECMGLQEQSLPCARDMSASDPQGCGECMGLQEQSLPCTSSPASRIRT